MLGGVLEPDIEERESTTERPPGADEFEWLRPNAARRVDVRLAAKEDEAADKPADTPADKPADEPDVVEDDEDLEEDEGDVADDDDDEFPEIDEDLIDLDDEWDEKDLDEDERHDNPHRFNE